LILPDCALVRELLTLTKDVLSLFLSILNNWAREIATGNNSFTVTDLLLWGYRRSIPTKDVTVMRKRPENKIPKNRRKDMPTRRSTLGFSSKSLGWIR